MRESSPEFQINESRFLRAGTCIGPDLTVTGVLGAGGTGVVYRAEHAVLHREVAVKMSNVTGPLENEARARLIREARMCASIRSPHVPRMYALSELEDGTPFIVMELVEGATLSHLLCAQLLSVREACALGCELLDALAAVHRRGIVHRDIKPSNLMANLEATHARLRLLDFGVGKIVSNDDLDLPALTCRGELLGTPLYMAPEQVLAQPIDARADLYSAGIVLYEMLSGHAPFEGYSVGAVFAAVLRDEIEPLSTHRKGLPSSLSAVVKKATAKQVEHRFASAQAMRDALYAAWQEVQALGDKPELAGSVHEHSVELTPTLVFTPAPSEAEKRRRRTISLSFARTVRAARDEEGASSRVMKRPNSVGSGNASEEVESRSDDVANVRSEPR